MIPFVVSPCLGEGDLLCVHVLISAYKDISRTGLWPEHMPLLVLNCVFKNSIHLPKNFMMSFL